MKLDFFQNQTIDAMEAYMTRLSQRQQIVASNLSNIDTPGYRAKDVSFHATMEELLSETPAPLRIHAAEPLLAAMADKTTDRYLKPFARDFFYVTVKN